MARSILRAGKIAGVVIVAIIVVAAVLFSVGVLSVAQADDLLAQCESSYTQASDYWQVEKYDEAKALYQYIYQNSSDSSLAFKARTGIAGCQIRMGHYSDAELAIETLMDDYSQHPELCENIYELAESYRKWLEHDKAKAIYQYISQNSPNSDLVLAARKGIILTRIDLGDAENAGTEVAGLLADYEADEGMAEFAHQVGDQLYKKKFYERALGLYEYAVGNYAESKEAIAAQRGVVLTNICLEDEEAARQALDELTLRFADDPRLPQELYNVGERYRRLKNYPAARNLYDYIAVEFPQGNYAMWSDTRQIIININETEDPNDPQPQVPGEILQAVDDLITNYSGQKELARAVFYLGEEYYLKIRSREGELFRNTHRYDNAIRIWEIVINKLPYEYTYTPFAYYLAAHCCDKTEQYDKAIAFYEKLTEDGYRHGRYAYRAPYRLGELYRNRRDYEKAKYWFIKQRELHNHSLVGSRATFALAMLHKGPLRDYAKTVEVLEDYKQWYPLGEKMKFIPIQLAICYEKLGMKSEAISELQDALEKYPGTSYVERYNEHLNRIQEGAN